jgi:hypothetical protein
MTANNYTIGNSGETNSKHYLQDNGFVFLTNTQKKHISGLYSLKGIQVKFNGFDCIHIEDYNRLFNQDSVNDLDLPILYELKTTGEKRGEKINEGFKNLGFTLTKNELDNANNLSENFKFIFLNLFRKTHKIVKLEDFFNDEKARLYPTYSVFIKEDI